MSANHKSSQEKLDAALQALAAAGERLECQKAEHRLNTLELEESRSALQSMLENLKCAHEQIERAHHEWIGALDAVEDPIFLHDKEFRVLRCNKAYQRCAGLPFKQIIGMPYYEIFPKMDAPLPCCRRLKEKNEAAADEDEFEVGDAIYRLRAFTVYDKQGNYLHSLHIFEDVTESRRSEIAVRHANRALAALSAVNRGLVRADSEDKLLHSICKAIVEGGGYQMAWVGYRQNDARKSVLIKAQAGIDARSCPDTMQPTWAEDAQGMGPCGRAIRSGKTKLCQDIANDAHYSPWRNEALKCGYASSIALPLLDAGNAVFGVLAVYAGEINAFSAAEIDLLEEMAGDMAFGVRSLRTRRERDLAMGMVQQHLVKLEGSLEDTVRAIASIVEMRDPYTAGHQTRVADLALAIATQMGLSPEQVHGIHLAGVVHDLGKIHIPAEILSKPGKINATEYDLIKTHAQSGYDILKDIEFPWPIAQMVWQHHERLDGSGYPQGLKGDQIILESRILSVADVVEAMASHRPYRAGLGVELALAEIGGKRGTHFDPVVTDACMALFREKNYVLPS